MNDLRELINQIIARPEIYIGKRSLERLYAFISGYLYYNTLTDSSCLEGFTEYVAKKYGINTDHNWARIIDFFSSDENEAFDTFIKLFNTFNSGGKDMFLL